MNHFIRKSSRLPSRSLTFYLIEILLDVLADTLRSIALIVAAVVAQLAPQAVTPTEADSAAAIIVSTIILVSLVPLLRGLTRRLVELRRICREERLEARDSQRRVAEVKPGDQD